MKEQIPAKPWAAWGRALRRFRQQAGYQSQKEFADALSATPLTGDTHILLEGSQLSRFETGERCPATRQEHLRWIEALSKLGALRTPAEADNWLALGDQGGLHGHERKALFGNQLQSPQPTTPTAVHPPAQEPSALPSVQPPTSGRATHRWAHWAIAALLMLGAVGAWWWTNNRNSKPPLPPVRTFAIIPWENLSPGSSADEGVLTEGTRTILYAKLMQVPGLQGYWQDVPPSALAQQGQLDFWIKGNYQQVGLTRLSAIITTSTGRILPPVTVTEQLTAIDRAGTAVCILALQNQLVYKILAALEITVDQALITAIDRTPTSSCEALQLNNQAAAFIVEEQLESAAALLDRAIALDPTYADAYNNLGQIAAQRGDWTVAQKHYEQAIRLLPDNPVYYLNLGLNYEQQNQWPAAIDAYEQAIGRDPRYAKAYNNLGYTLLLNGQPTDALAYLKIGVGLQPKSAFLHKNLGRAYGDLQQPAQAVAELTQATQLYKLITVDPFAEALFYLAQAQAALQQPSAACATLAQYALVAGQDQLERAQAAAQLRTHLACQPTSVR